MMKNGIAFCGLDCEHCDARIATVNHDEKLREKVAKLWSEWNHTEILPEYVVCEGCKGDGVKCYFCGELCQIRKCAISKGFDSCGQCAEMESCKTLKMITDNSEVAKKNLKKSK